MHIHGGNMNPNLSLGGAHASSSAQAARRAEETRKKLFAASSELDATSSTESAWMISAWAGGDSPANHGSSHDSGQDHPDSHLVSFPAKSDQFRASAEVEQVSRTASARPVSFWA
jgi:hypothetical protein